ncbi:MAG: hypothetical protein AB7V42_00380 [Thermoleophilia bacterium]
MRALTAILAAALVALVAAACGPAGPTDAGGTDADPVALLGVLPSPEDLRGAPAQAVDPAGLQVALTGAPDPVLVDRIRTRNPKAAAVREWTAPGGRRLVAVVSVWDSHLIAVGIGADAADMLPDGRAWTPADLPGSQGARSADGRRLSFAVGPNSIYVRGEGSVSDDVVATAAHRLALVLEGEQ